MRRKKKIIYLRNLKRIKRRAFFREKEPFQGITNTSFSKIRHRRKKQITAGNKSKLKKLKVFERYDPLDIARYKQNQGLIKYLALIYYDRYENCFYKDFVQAGKLGLVRAIETYNPNKKTVFNTHCGNLIRNAMYDWAHRDVGQNHYEQLHRRVALDDYSINEYDSRNIQKQPAIQRKIDKEEQIIILKARIKKYLKHDLQTDKKNIRCFELRYFEEKSPSYICDVLGFETEHDVSNICYELRVKIVRHLRKMKDKNQWIEKIF